MLSGKLDSAAIDRWSRELNRLIEMESKAFPAAGDALGETMTDESLDPYYIWQNRN